MNLDRGVSHGSGVSVTSSELTLDGVEDFLVIELLLVNAHPVEHLWWHDELDDQSPDKREATNADADNLLNCVQWNSLEGTSSNIDEGNLDDDDDHKNDKESDVVEEVSEDVVLVIQELSGIDHVEDLAHDESLEDNSVNLALVGWSVKNICWIYTSNLVNTRATNVSVSLWILVKPS